MATALWACGPSPETADDDQAVVVAVAHTRGIDESQARDEVASTRRAAAAFLRGDGTLDPARELQLRRSAMVRHWLEEQFEPTHRPEDIPDAEIAKRLADPQVARRLFHPRIHLTCQVVLVPKASEATSEAWRERAAVVATPLEQRLLRYLPDLEAEQDCTLFNRIIKASNLDHNEDIETKIEQFPTLPDAGLDKGFVAAVTSLEEPGLVEPFFTRFGRHIVFVPRILPAYLEDGSASDAELETQRSEHLREEFAEAWRAESLAHALDQMRSDRVVRVAKGEALGEPAL